MLQDEKIRKVCDDFSLLNEDQQDYILGIIQALVFARTANDQSSAAENSKIAPGSEKQ